MVKNGKIISVLFVLIFCISTLKSQTVSYWDGIDTSVWTNGKGTMGMPYLIESAGNLACLAKRVNQGNNYTGVYFKLTTNVNLGAGSWTPIGISTTNYFSGYFDGDYYTIDSLYINKAATANSFVGLFGVVQNSTIQKVILSNVNVSQTSVSVNIYTGALVGATIGGDYIRNCTILSGTVSSVSTTGNKAYAGGIVGCSQFGVKNIKIENCTNAASIYANCAVGGIVGMFNVTSTNSDTLWLLSCSNTGNIYGLPSTSTGNVYTGGVVGWLNLQRNNTQCYIDNCYNTAYVKDSTDAGQYVFTGGLIGYIQNTASANTAISGSISNSWNSGKVENLNTSLDFSTTNWSYIGGIVGNLTFYGVATFNFLNVYNTGEIYFLRRSPKTTSSVGGILGLSSTQTVGSYVSVQQSYNTGNIILSSPDTANNLTNSGGIIGWLYCSQGNYYINKCFNVGNINNDSYYSGGIIGYVGGFYTTGNTINNCFNSGNVKAKNTAGGIAACYVQKTLGNVITNCINVGPVKTSHGGNSAIAGTLGDSTTLDLATCYYDRQISGVNRGASILASIGSIILNDTIRYARQVIQLQLDTIDWYMETNMFPRLKAYQSLDVLILGATPLYMYADTTIESYNNIYKINKSFKIGGKSGTYFYSSNSSVLSIIDNDSASVNPTGVDTVIFTYSYGVATRAVTLIVKKETYIETETCQGDEYVFCGRNINTSTSGVYLYYGVDSVIEVTVNPVYFFNESNSKCENDTFIWHGKLIDTAGIYYDSLFSAHGCDSVYMLTLSEYPIYNIYENRFYCRNELPAPFYNYLIISCEGDYVIKLTSVYGCDSIINLHVDVNEISDTIIVEFVDQSEFPYTYGSQIIRDYGTYEEIFSKINGCDSIVNLVVLPLPNDISLSICKISVSSDNKNVIEWEKPSTHLISNFIVYRETDQTDVYSPIGTVSYDSAALYTDNTSTPSYQAYRYKIGAMTVYGNTTQLSPYHQTIHLTINKGIGNVYNLIWSSYEGLEYNTYRLLKGTSIDSMTLLTEIAGHLNSYTDEAEGTIYYQIEIIPTETCELFTTLVPYYLKSNEINSRSIKSNIVCNQASNILSYDYSQRVFVSPNPAQDFVDVKWEDGITINEIVIYDMYGKRIKNENINGFTRIDMSELSNGIYILQVKNNQQIIGNYKVVRNK